MPRICLRGRGELDGGGVSVWMLRRLRPQCRKKLLCRLGHRVLAWICGFSKLWGADQSGEVMAILCGRSELRKGLKRHEFMQNIVVKWTRAAQGEAL